MNEIEAQDILLGKPRGQLILGQVERALKESCTIFQFKGEFEYTVSQGYTGLLIVLKDKE